MLQADFSRGGEERRNTNQIISGRDEDEKPFNQVAAAMQGFAQSSNGLHPPERFFDPLAGGQTDAIGGIMGGKAASRIFPDLPLRVASNRPPRALRGYEGDGRSPKPWRTNSSKLGCLVLAPIARILFDLAG